MDDDFWDERATILKYHAKRLNERGSGTDEKTDGTREPAQSSEELHQRAVEDVGEVSFHQLNRELEIESQFLHLNTEHIKAGATIGVTGAVAAFITGHLGDKLEKVFLDEVDFKHPADYWTGAEHRNYYGHDILNPWQELPEGFNLPKAFEHGSGGAGGRPLIELVQERYDFSLGHPALNLLRAYGQTFLHWFRDLLTPAGLPLPGMSYFTDWVENAVNVSGFSSKNEVMDALGREFGTVQLSDIGSLLVVKVLVDRYIMTHTDDVPDNQRELFDRQMRVAAYGSCIITQLSYLAYSMILEPSLKSKPHAAKANLIMLGVFGKNAGQLCKLTQQRHRAVMATYEESIALLEQEELSLEEWVETL
jgi:hypothetical protein